MNNHWSWYTTNIRDRHGNTIDITYKTNSSNFIYIDTVTASDGRQVKFEYLDEESAYIRLNRITANEQTWTYRYESIEAIGPGYGDNYHNLTEVIRPDGLRWRYSYYPYTSLDAAGNYALKTVTYPYGANITYTYQHIDFTPTDLAIDRTTAIATKEVSGNPPGISVGPGSSLPSGIWRFEFEPHSPELFFTDKGTWTSGLDKTTGECRAASRTTTMGTPIPGGCRAVSCGRPVSSTNNKLGTAAGPTVVRSWDRHWWMKLPTAGNRG